MTATALLAALALDLLLGDPRSIPHPVVAVGRWIQWLEGLLTQRLGRTKRAGVLLTFLTLTAATGVAASILWGAGLLHPWLGIATGILMAYTTLALKGLHQESRKVIRALEEEDLAEARKALSLIVGRDTEGLDEEAVLRACIETVAENSSDAVIGPLFYLWLGGPLLAVAYKVVNTLDSMVGYRNERYREVGWASARLDDLANWIPARLTGLAMVAVAPLIGLSGPHGWRILRRDRQAHSSPNAGWPEAAAAGTLGIQLGGASTYQGVLCDKPTLGDPSSPISTAHYGAMIRLMYGTAATVVATLLLLSFGRVL